MTKEIRSQNGTAVGREGFPRGFDLRASSFPRHSSSVIRHFLLGSCAVLLTATLRAQLGLPAETNLFGDDIVRKIDVGGRFAGGEDEGGRKPRAKVPGFDHALIFHDGRQLRGELVELTKSEVVWRRPDASEPLRFARDGVLRMVLAPGVESDNSAGRRMVMANMEVYICAMIRDVAGGLGGIIAEAVAQSVTVDLARAARVPQIVQTMTVQMAATMKQMGVGVAEEKIDVIQPPELPGDKPPSATATLKLPGGDWLFGGVTSADGETFALKLADGTVLAIPRGPVEWLCFGAQPAPAFGFAGGALDLDSWPVRTAGTRMEVAGGTLTLRDGWLLGRALTPPKRFEVAFEVPEDSEEGLRLWIQPFGPQPNSFGTGTVELVFGKKEISHCIYVRKFERKKTPLPKEAAGAKGPAGYRVLYDGIGKHLAVLRNGALLGDWKFEEDDGKDAINEDRDFTINGVCFDAEEHGSRPGLKFNRLRVQPWDGALPVAGAEEPDGDRLSAGREPPVSGRLESIAEKELLFSGAKKPRTEGTFIQLHKTAPSLAEADAMLVFGQQGEVSVAGLEIRDGRAHGRTGFTEALDFPAAALQTVAFPARPPGAEIPADALVFKNGDELRGTLLAAAAGGAVRWKMAGGQELEFHAVRLAGVRFAAGGAARKNEEPAMVELRNGDRLRGKFVGLDERQLQFEHAQLGMVAIARESLWSLYPNPHFAVIDGGRDAAAWQALRSKKEDDDGRAVAATAWTVLDGSYILRGQRSSSGGQESPSLNVPMKNLPERFEIRVEATNVNETLPNFGIMLGTKNSQGAVNATFSYFDLYIYINNPKARGRQNSKNISLRDKLPDASSRQALRVFVNRTAGTADFYLNGALVARTGQQATERLPGLGEVVSITANPNQVESAMILSNLWVGPWDGELPRPGEGVPPVTALANGDLAPNAPAKVQDGKFVVESEAGSLELPLEKVQAVEFGGAMAPEQAAARVRLVDGCTVHVDGFRWDGKNLAAHSATLGDLRLSAGAVSELIFDPAPVRPPRLPAAKKLAQKDQADAAAEPVPAQ